MAFVTAVDDKSGHLKVPAVWVGAECTVKKRGKFEKMGFCIYSQMTNSVGSLLLLVYLIDNWLIEQTFKLFFKPRHKIENSPPMIFNSAGGLGRGLMVINTAVLLLYLQYFEKEPPAAEKSCT